MRIREPRELRAGVSFKNFAALASKKSWTVADLSRTFKQGFDSRLLGNESSASFFRRVLECDPNPNVAIPYVGIVNYYLTAASELIADERLRGCACGCGSPVFGTAVYAWDDCSKRCPSEPRTAVDGREAIPIAQSPTSPLKPTRREGAQRAEFAPDMALNGVLA
jgi:hypothetical protein